MEKQTYDMRGKQSSIFRLLSFNAEAFMHMLFYRILIFVALVVGIVLAFSLTYPASAEISTLQHIGILAVWALFIPEVFETAKALSVIMSRGVAWGRLNSSFLNSLPDSDKRLRGFYTAVPVIAIVVWICVFAYACVVLL